MVDKMDDKMAVQKDQKSAGKKVGMLDALKVAMMVG